MAKRGKAYEEFLAKRPTEAVSVAKAVKFLKDNPTAKFDQTVELSMHLGIDPRQADQALRGSISLPNGIGVSRKVIAFCEENEVEDAKAAGAVEAGGEELVAKIQGGWMDFDVVIAKPQMMKVVSKLGRQLGPQGLMPSPKSGTVVQDVPQAVKEFSAGKVEYRNDAGGNLHVTVGKCSFEPHMLLENIVAFIDHVRKIRPTTTKGTYIHKATLSATMSPSLEIDLSKGQVAEDE